MPTQTIDPEAQAIYDELNKRGVFKADDESQAIGHELRARGVVSDPTQGGLVASPSSAPVDAGINHQQSPRIAAVPTPPVTGPLPVPSHAPGPTPDFFTAPNGQKVPVMRLPGGAVQYRSPNGLDPFAIPGSPVAAFVQAQGGERVRTLQGGVTRVVGSRGGVGYFDGQGRPTGAPRATIDSKDILPPSVPQMLARSGGADEGLQNIATGAEKAVRGAGRIATALASAGSPAQVLSGNGPTFKQAQKTYKAAQKPVNSAAVQAGHIAGGITGFVPSAFEAGTAALMSPTNKAAGNYLDQFADTNVNSAGLGTGGPIKKALQGDVKGALSNLRGTISEKPLEAAFAAAGALGLAKGGSMLARARNGQLEAVDNTSPVTNLADRAQVRTPQGEPEAVAPEPTGAPQEPVSPLQAAIAAHRQEQAATPKPVAAEPEPIAPEPVAEPHHSALQPRDESGHFNGPPQPTIQPLPEPASGSGYSRVVHPDGTSTVTGITDAPTYSKALQDQFGYDKTQADTTAAFAEAHAGALEAIGGPSKADWYRLRVNEMHQGIDPVTGRSINTPAETIPAPTEPSQPQRLVENYPLSAIKTDPERFQYKLGSGQGGSTGSVSDSKVWDPELAGVAHVWTDPANGHTYAVNGHNRVALANKLGVPGMDVRFLDAQDAASARTKGALINIAEGHGTAIDAAKLFRDAGMNADDLAKHGISMKGEKARQGLALAKLSPSLFNATVRGEIPIERAALIGEKLPSIADQQTLISQIDKYTKSGRNITNETISELADQIAGAPRYTSTQSTLFGDDEVTQSLSLERAETAAYIRRMLSQESRAFGNVAKNAGMLAKGKNIIDADTSAGIAQNNNIARDIFDRSKNNAGPVSDILNSAAKRIADGENASHVKQQALEAIQSYVTEFRKGSHGQAEAGLPPRGTDGAATDQAGQTTGEVDNQGSLFNTSSGQARAAVRIKSDGTTIWHALRSPTIESGIHELGHIFRRDLADMAASGHALSRADLATAEKWAGVKNGVWETEHEEKFTNALVQYAREGVTPTPELKPVFERFKAWLTGLYGSIKGTNLDAGLSPAMRQVFDRQLGKDTAPKSAPREPNFAASINLDKVSDDPGVQGAVKKSVERTGTVKSKVSWDQRRKSSKELNTQIEDLKTLPVGQLPVNADGKPVSPTDFKDNIRNIQAHFAAEDERTFSEYQQALKENDPKAGDYLKANQDARDALDIVTPHVSHWAGEFGRGLNEQRNLAEGVMPTRTAQVRQSLEEAPTLAPEPAMKVTTKGAKPARTKKTFQYDDAEANAIREARAARKSDATLFHGAGEKPIPHPAEQALRDLYSGDKNGSGSAWLLRDGTLVNPSRLEHPDSASRALYRAGTQNNKYPMTGPNGYYDPIEDFAQQTGAIRVIKGERPGDFDTFQQFGPATSEQERALRKLNVQHYALMDADNPRDVRPTMRQRDEAKSMVSYGADHVKAYGTRLHDGDVFYNTAQTPKLSADDMGDLTKLGAFHIERGAKDLESFAKKIRGEEPNLSDTQVQAIRAHAQADLAGKINRGIRKTSGDVFTDQLAQRFGSRKAVSKFLDQIADEDGTHTILDHIIHGKAHELTTGQKAILEKAYRDNGKKPPKRNPSTGALADVDRLMDAQKQARKTAPTPKTQVEKLDGYFGRNLGALGAQILRKHVGEDVYGRLADGTATPGDLLKAATKYETIRKGRTPAPGQPGFRSQGFADALKDYRTQQLSASKTPRVKTLEETFRARVKQGLKDNTDAFYAAVKADPAASAALDKLHRGDTMTAADYKPLTDTYEQYKPTTQAGKPGPHADFNEALAQAKNDRTQANNALPDNVLNRNLAARVGRENVDAFRANLATRPHGQSALDKLSTGDTDLTADERVVVAEALQDAKQPKRPDSGDSLAKELGRIVADVKAGRINYEDPIQRTRRELSSLSPDRRGEITTRLANIETSPDGKPTPQGYKDLFAYRRDVARQAAKEAFRSLSLPEKAGVVYANVSGAKRAIQTGFDISAAGRQGYALVAANPRLALWGKDSPFVRQLAAFRSEKAAMDVLHDIHSRPNAVDGTYKKAGLAITKAEPGGSLQKLSEHEENFMSSLVNHIPGLAGSERAYTTFLNKLRADNFDYLADIVRRREGKLTDPDAKQIANFVNDATGRADLAKMNSAAPLLNGIIFSPRFVASRARLLTLAPLWTGGGGLTSRALIAGTYLQSVAGMGVVLGLLKLSGASVSFDNRSSDYLKAKYKNHVIVDPMAGLSQLMVLAGREIKQEKVTQSGHVQKLGKGFGADDGLDIAGKFLRSKLAPDASLVADVLARKDFLGNPITPVGTKKEWFMDGEIAKQTVPMSLPDILEASRKQGLPAGVAVFAGNTLGIGVNYQPPKQPGHHN